jgi:hypothetical protein
MTPVIVDDPRPFEPAPVAVPATTAADAPGFLGSARPRALPAPRWHWLLVAGLALLLVLQSVLADRARLAADAGNRAWLGALCGVLRCSLPAWHEPTAFTMTSREIRPLPGQAGVLQVQASIRNDARWAQAWPDLRLSLSDADGRVIGSGVFTPRSTWARTPAPPCWNRARARAHRVPCRSPPHPPSHSPSTSSDQVKRPAVAGQARSR